MFITRLILLSVTGVVVTSLPSVTAAATPVVGSSIAARAASGPAVATPAATDDPAGTIVLAHGSSAYPKTVPPMAAATVGSSTWVVFQDERGLMSQQKGASQATLVDPTGYLLWSAGPMLLFQDYNTHIRYWYDLVDGSSGPAPAVWTSAAPTGGLIVDRADPATMRVRVQDIDGTTRLLAKVAYTGPSSDFVVVAGGLGVVVSYHPDVGATGPSFLGYVPYSGGGLHQYSLSGVPAADLKAFNCGAPSSGGVACATQGSGDIFGAPLSAPSAVQFAAGTGSVGPVLSSTSVGWLTYSDGAQRLATAPIAGGAVTVSTTPSDAGQAVSDGSFIYVDIALSPAKAGFYRSRDATTTPVPVVVLGAIPLQASAVAIAPGGRVEYVDNRRTDGPVWQQTLSRTPGGVTAGGRSLVASGSTGYGLALSGARLGYAASDGSFKIVSPLRPPVSLGTTASVSGTRAMVNAVAGATIVSLNTGASVATSSFGDDGYLRNLFGDLYTFVKADNSVWRKNLATNAAPMRLLAAPGAGVSTDSVVAWGDWVAVNRNLDGEGTLTVVNTHTGVTRTEAGYWLSSASAAGYVLGSTVLHSWDGAHTLPVNGAYLGSTAAFLTWIGADGLVRAAPMPWTTPDVPRSLGNPLAPATVVSGATWAFDLPTSAPLTSCRVDILKGTKVIRTLSCDPALMGGGDAVVRWDTKNTSGGAAATGPYTWRVKASNADGPLQLATGSAGTVSGSVSVTSG